MRVSLVIDGDASGAKKAAQDASAAVTGVTTAAANANTATKSANDNVAKSAGLARHEMVNLSRQIQDVGVSLASGQSPFTVLVQQGTQVADIFASSTGTVGGFFGQVTSGLGKILTPARLVAGSIAAIALTAATATISWQDSQKATAAGLQGIGRASGATIGDINRIAESSRSFGSVSTSSAREFAIALAATGKIGVENIELLTSQAKNFSNILGTDIPKAGEYVAKVFASPGEGAKELAQRIGGIDAATIKYVATLEQQGDRQAAIKALYDAVAPSIAKTVDQTGFWGKALNVVSDSAGRAYDSTGKLISQLGVNGVNQQTESVLEKQRKELEALIQTTANAGLPEFDVSQMREQLNAVNDALLKIQQSRKAALGVDAAQTTLQASPIVDALAPAPAIIRNVTANLELLTKVMNDPAFESFRQKVGEQLPLALARLQNQASALALNPRLADPIQSQIDNLTIQNKLLSDQSPAMRQRVESQLAYNEAIKQGASAEEAAALATAKGKQAYGGVATDIQQAQTRLSLYGQTTTAAEAQRAVELNLQAAHLQGISIDSQRAALLKQLAADQAIGVTQIRASTDAQNVEAATVGMSAGKAAEYAAAQNAINEARRSGRELTPENISQIEREAAAFGRATANADLLKSAYTGLVQGPWQTFNSSIARGSTAWDAFKKAGTSALTAVSSKLIDIAAQNLWGSAFGGSGGGGLLGLLGIGGGGSGGGIGTMQVGSQLFPTIGFDAGGYTGRGGRLEPAGVVHKGEYVFDQASVGRAGVGFFAGLHRSLRGYADGGLVGGSSGGGWSGASGRQKVDVVVSFDNNGNLQAFVKNVSMQSASDTLGSYVGSPQFVDHVGDAATLARTQRKL
ncbi:phage tail length tape measure family protein [Bradyrhizobium sp. 191]|uniref:phage tail length tape measure family protein n=1 Tax=Bradyrhizobium sp. 191 TaxID=2782659 RepID=UPI00200026F0|nr:phage tail length tape measure family protein [Bradyrhizobium sp. 191]UPJ65227.1 phage tail length tape measure family protein [Bradyrhizobium sp. 191]